MCEECVELCCVFAGDYCNSGVYVACLEGRGECIREVSGYHCECLDGYDGQHCERKHLSSSDVTTCSYVILRHVVRFFCADEVNYCASNPCANGACVSFFRGYNCSCSAGYAGQLCESRSSDVTIFV